MGINKKDI